MALLALRPQPPEHVRDLLGDRDWPGLTAVLDQGFPPNAAWPGRGSLFENFVIASSTPTPVPGTHTHRLQMRTLAAFLRAGLSPTPPFQDDVHWSLPLSIAGLFGRVDYLQALLAAGHPVNGLGPGRQSPMALLCAREMGGPNPAVKPFEEVRPALEVLLAAGADVNQPEDGGWRPLALAAACGSEPLVAWLLKAGADPNPRGAGFPSEPGPKFTAVNWAIQRNDGRVLARLRAAGAKLVVPHAPGVTSVEAAGRHAGPEIWIQLVEALGWEHREIRRGWCQAVVSNARQTVMWFMAAGYDIHRPTEEGWTALDLASMHGALDVGRLLASAGLDPHRRGLDGQTPWQRFRANGGHEALMALGWQPRLAALPGGQHIGRT